jgi:hypothetical protein
MEKPLIKGLQIYFLGSLYMHFEMDHILTPYELFPFLGCLTFVHSVFNTVVDEGNVILHYILILIY